MFLRRFQAGTHRRSVCFLQLRERGVAFALSPVLGGARHRDCIGRDHRGCLCLLESVLGLLTLGGGLLLRAAA